MTSKPPPGADQPSDSRPAEGRPGGSQLLSDQGVRDSDVTSATFGYLGAIFLGPVIPLAVYALRARRSPFMRYHATAAVNLSVTGALYAVCCLILGGLLLLDSVTAALLVALPAGFMIWMSTLRYLIRGVIAANRNERYEVPSWICAHIVN